MPLSLIAWFALWASPSHLPFSLFFIAPPFTLPVFKPFSSLHSLTFSVFYVIPSSLIFLHQHLFISAVPPLSFSLFPIYLLALLISCRLFIFSPCPVNMTETSLLWHPIVCSASICLSASTNIWHHQSPQKMPLFKSNDHSFCQGDTHPHDMQTQPHQKSDAFHPLETMFQYICMFKCNRHEKSMNTCFVLHL